MPGLPSPFRRRVAVVLLGVLVVCCRPAAALDEAARCLQDKLRADRHAASAYLFCARAAAHDDSLRDRCLEKAGRRLNRRLAAADTRAAGSGFDCPAGAEALGMDGLLAWPLQLLDEAAAGDGVDCTKAKAGAVRRFASAYSRCVEFRLQRDEPADEFEACAVRAREQFLEGWQAAASGESCAMAVDGASEAERVESEIEESASRLQVRCGDRFVAGFEECDDGATVDGDGCSADCRRESCARVGEEVRCVACSGDSVPTRDHDGCRCDVGFSGEPGACVDMDECAGETNPCDSRPCVNLPGTFACAIACNADAFHQALADCGAPSGAIAFDCTDTVIAIPAGAAGGPRDIECDDLTIDGAGRGISFELDPLCWRTPLDPSQCPGGLEEDGTCLCPDVNSGETFLLLRGDDNVVRDLTVRGFFEGIPVRGRGNVVEDVRFERMCDDAFGSVAGGVGNVFRRLTVRDGCDKCSESDGFLGDTDPDPRVDAHFNAILSDVDFERCRTPVRVASSGRFLLRDVSMTGGDEEFPCDGPRFSAGSDSARVTVHLERSTIEGCRRGLRFGRGADGIVTDTRIAGCELRGLRAALTARVSVEGSTIEQNGGHGSTEGGFGGVAVVDSAAIDLGGGTLEIDGQTVQSAGQNSLCGNLAADGTKRELDNATDASVAAMGNWWCTTGLPTDRVIGAAELEPVLGRAPLRVRP